MISSNASKIVPHIFAISELGICDNQSNIRHLCHSHITIFFLHKTEFCPNRRTNMIDDVTLAIVSDLNERMDETCLDMVKKEKKFNFS